LESSTVVVIVSQTSVTYYHLVWLASGFRRWQ